MVEPLNSERTYRLVRQALALSRADEFAAQAADLEAALTSMDGIDGFGRTDHNQLRQEMKRRFATSIAKGKSVSGREEDSLQVYVNKASEKAIDQGYAETVLTRSYRKVIVATSTIGTATDMSFDYLFGDGASNTDVAALIEKYHAEGGYRQALIRADRLSVGLGSSAMYVRWHENGPKYQAVPPQNVFAKYAATVNSNGVVRAVDITDIDDATCVGIRLPNYQTVSTGTPEIRILLYCGRSNEYPQGRCCIYTVSSPAAWADAPPPSPAGPTGRLLEEYVVDGAIANPMTVAQNAKGDAAVPTEYPVAIFLGQESSADLGLLPTNGLALWRDTTEFDIAYSRVLSSAVEGARGLMVVTDGQTGAPLPTSMTGAVAGREGMTITKVGHEGAAAAASALTVLEAVSNRISNAYSVPAYMMTHDGTKAPTSGYSLDVQNMPLDQRRRERVALNRPSVDRVWWIEKGLHAALAAPGAIEIPDDVEQKWNPGEVSKPVNRKEQIENLDKAQASKYLNYIGAVREYHNFKTDEQAVAYIVKKAEETLALNQQLGKIAALELSITDYAKFVTVNEARVSRGLLPLVLASGSPDPDGALTLAEFEAKSLARVKAEILPGTG